MKLFKSCFLFYFLNNKLCKWNNNIISNSNFRQRNFEYKNIKNDISVYYISFLLLYHLKEKLKFIFNEERCFYREF